MSSTGAREVVRAAFTALLNEDRAGDDVDDVPLAHLGVDSLDFFETLMLLEENHGIVIPVARLHADLTLSELFDMLE